MKFYMPEDGDKPEDAQTITAKFIVDPDVDDYAEAAAAQYMQDADGDYYNGWPRVFVIVDR